MNPNTFDKYNKFVEYMWLVIAAVCLVSGLYFFLYRKSTEEGMMMLLFTALAVGIYSFRRVFRRRLERQRQKEQEQGKRK